MTTTIANPSYYTLTHNHLLRLLLKEMENAKAVTCGTYNKADPTVYVRGECWVYFDHDPLPHIKKRYIDPYAETLTPEPKDPTWEPYQGDVLYQIKYHDLTWNKRVTVLDDSGKVLFEEMLDFGDEHFQLREGRMAEATLPMTHLLMSAILFGRFSKKKPKLDYEED